MVKNKLSNREIEKHIEYVKATLAIEGLTLTDEEIELLRKYVKGQITKKDLFNIWGINAW